jgi:hypothetical protein
MAPTSDYGEYDYSPSRRTSKVRPPGTLDHLQVKIGPPFGRKSKRRSMFMQAEGMDEPYVTEQVPFEVKERAVQKRMKAVTAIQELMAGKLPTNEQLMSLIDRMRTSQAVQEGRSRMSPDGLRYFLSMILGELMKAFSMTLIS